MRRSEFCNTQGKVDVTPTRVKNKRINKGEEGKARLADMSDLHSKCIMWPTLFRSETGARANLTLVV